MRVTEKGQVTIPRHIRERLGIGPGAEVEFVLDEAGVRLVKVPDADGRESRGERLVRLLREAGQAADWENLTTDEIMEMTRGRFDDIDAR